MTPADVAVELADFAPASGSERSALRAMLTLLDTVPAPARRSTFDPGHLTASAVLRDRQHGRVLLIHHAKLGRWLQPGGHIEPGDASLLQAARREVIEEVGSLTVVDRGIIDLDIHQIPAFGSEPPHLHYDVRFLFDVEGGEPAAGDGALGIRWVGRADLGEIATDESVVRLVHKALR